MSCMVAFCYFVIMACHELYLGNILFSMFLHQFNSILLQDNEMTVQNTI